jgi:hypothetical protein
MMRKLTIIFGSTLVLLAAPPTRGIRPRPSPQDYPVHEQAVNTTYGAAALSKQEIRNSFASNVANGYIVLEVGVFPAKAQKIDLEPDNFLLRIGGTGDLIRPASGDTVASVLQRKNTPRPSSPSDVTVYPSVGVGYESGPDIYGRRTSGWTTAAGVGVGVGQQGPPYAGPAPGSTDRDRQVMAAELADKQLPDGTADAPVAGYLYFPVPSKKKLSGVYELDYDNGGKTVRLYVPPPKS